MGEERRKSLFFLNEMEYSNMHCNPKQVKPVSIDAVLVYLLHLGLLEMNLFHYSIKSMGCIF